MDYAEWIKKAQLVIKTELKDGTEFELKSLFKQFEWNLLANAEKRSFARYFSNEVKEGRVESVIHNGNTQSKHNKYVRIQEN